MTITLEYEDGSVTQEEFQKEVTELGKAVLEALQKQGRCRIGVALPCCCACMSSPSCNCLRICKRSLQRTLPTTQPT